MSTSVLAPGCLECGEPIKRSTGRGRPRKYCSKRCLLLGTNKQRPEADWVRGEFFLTRECRECGTDLNQAEKLVCADCTATKRRENGHHKLRQWRLTVPCEPYTLEEIAARDGFRCQICVAMGRKRWSKVDMRLTFPNRMAPTIDHIVPKSRGGDDTRANVQLAHFACNAWKHTGRRELQEQLALFG